MWWTSTRVRVVAVGALLVAGGACSSDTEPAAAPITAVPSAGPSTAPAGAGPGAVDLDTVGLDAEVDGVLEVYCLLDANGETHDVGIELALPGFDADELESMQWVHDVIGSSDGSAAFVSAALADPAVDSDLDTASQVVLTDSTKTFLFQNEVPLIDVETIYPFRTGARTATVLTTYLLDDQPQMLTQRWVVESGIWVRG